MDFWTYTCINCIRTLPYVASWYDKYKEAGFVVVGVHTPEFEFEKSTQNVQNAIKQYNIHYPVAQDNNYATWRAYQNQYWPAKYLIDAKGNVRYTHFGEGKYEETEKAIQSLLKEAGNKVGEDMVDMEDQTPKTRTSPETYLGSKRMQFLYPEGTVVNGTKVFEVTKKVPENRFSLGGEWTISDEYAMAGKNAVLEYNFKANKVFLVIRPGTTSTPEGKAIRILLDGKLVGQEFAGSDVKDGTVRLDVDRLYNLIDLKNKVENHILRLEYIDPGTSFFAFTFG